ncbi:hypothetical protein GCK72_020391 [Caenorhabditis remanei]|uniref:Uncharacterized protein n=1 Tax=Caenorhabditis remanei TaxID=31234 RepID=A0A6A5GGE9_CAERE|nr:hypothetical protein GCK72_020391 [Caenorhabditis remanei]KAF1753834.1 hypothetical protein GCK72_020391 [Caenorhabditis remanei]
MKNGKKLLRAVMTPTRRVDKDSNEEFIAFLTINSRNRAIVIANQVANGLTTPPVISKNLSKIRYEKLKGP